MQMVTAATKLKDTPWRKIYDRPRQGIKKQRYKKKSRDITLPTKVCIVMAFLVVIYRCESWAIKKDEC